MRGEVAGVLIPLLLSGLLASAVPAGVSVDAYEADEKTPLRLADPNIPGVYRDIMVGTRLALLITSDTAGIWDGQLWMSPEEAIVGTLSGRGYNPKGPLRNHQGSCLKAAGRNPLVSISAGQNGVSVNLLSAWDAQAGEWFVLDYKARAVGKCSVGLYEFHAAGNPNPYVEDAPSFTLELTDLLTFNHVPTRDFDGSKVVDFADFALLAAEIDRIGADPNESHPFDLNADQRIDLLDVAAFCEFWLERTDVSEPDADGGGL